MLRRDKLENTLLPCEQGNFDKITARSRNRTLVTVVRDTCTTTVPPAPHKCQNVQGQILALNKPKNANINRLIYI